MCLTLQKMCTSALRAVRPISLRLGSPLRCEAASLRRAGVRAGQQVDSTKETVASVAFSSATRDAAGRVFISVDHEKSGYGRESPGDPPASALLASNVQSNQGS